jgi:hypothetical protein
MTKAASIQPVREALSLITRLSRPEGLKWLVGGSTATILHGVSLAAPPHDLDIDAPGDGALKLGELLSSFVVSPVQRSDTDLYNNLFGRFDVNGTKVEILGDFEIKARSWSHRLVITEDLYNRCTEVTLQPGLTVRLVPLEHQLIVNLIRGRVDRVASISATLRGQGGPDQKYLQEIFERDRIPEQVRLMIDRLCVLKA